MDGYVIIKAVLDKKKFKRDLTDLENEPKVDELVDKISEKFSEIGEKFADIGKKFTNAFKSGSKGLKGITTKILNIGKIASSVIGSIIAGTIKWGVILTASLGIIGLLLVAFYAIMQALDKVGEEHTELSAQIQYIAYALKTILAPVIEWISNVIAKIIQLAINGVMFILALISRITGRALPSAKDFADNMKAAEGSTKKSAKNAKDIKNQLAGFDEMNTLQDNKGGGIGGVGGGFSTADLDAIDEAVKRANESVDGLFSKISEWWEKHWLKKKIEEWKEEINTFIENWKTGWGIMKDWFAEKWQAVVDFFNTFVENWKIGWGIIKNWFSETWSSIKEGFAKFFTETIPSSITKAKQWFEDAKKWFEEKWNKLKDGFISFFTESLPNAVRNAMQKVKDTITNIWNNIKAIFSTGGQVFDGIKDAIADTFKNIVNRLIDGINKVIATPLNAINKSLNKIHDIEILGLKPFKNAWGTNPIKIPVIPKLAKGGVINMPGRGVAIGGERGAEGVIPLTDSQQMELLGEAIGRYITINASIINTMNGRVISRELQKINNENSFAGNR